MADKFRFQLVGGHLALNFANTLDFRYDPERFIDLLSSYERLLAFFEQAGAISARQRSKLLATTSNSEARRALRRAIELRETIYFLFLSVLSARRGQNAHLRAFNRFLEDSRMPEKVTWQKRSLVRAYRDLAERAEGPLWAVIDAAADLLTSRDCLRIRECSEKTCRWLFLDQSKNHSRRWCDMKVCGNRVKARRFYARLRKQFRTGRTISR
jgi:predicted RNA-binding Zn ribbon-like protein